MAKFYCPTCKKVLPKALFPIHVGDKVTFTVQIIHETPNRMSIRLSTKTGKVMAIQDGVAMVEYRKQSYSVMLSSLSLASAPSDLMRLMIGECNCIAS